MKRLQGWSHFCSTFFLSVISQYFLHAYSLHLTPVSDSEEDLLEVANSEVLQQTNAKLIQESKNPFTPGKLYQREL